MLDKKSSKQIEKIKKLREENENLRKEIRQLKADQKKNDMFFQEKMQIVENTRLEYEKMLEDTRNLKGKYTKLLEQMKKTQKDMKKKIKEV